MTYRGEADGSEDGDNGRLNQHSIDRRGFLKEGATPMLFAAQPQNIGSQNIVSDFFLKDAFWKTKVDINGLSASPTIIGDTVYISGGELYAVDATTGSIKWSTSIDHGTGASTPEVKNGSVYYGSLDNNLYAVDANTGDEEWSFEADDRLDYSSPTVVDDTVYIGSGPEDGSLYSIDASSGEQNWSLNFVGGLSSPSVLGNTVYVTTSSELHAINTNTGKAKWSHDLGGNYPSSSSPVLEGDAVYVTSKNFLLHSVDRQTGEENWTFNQVSVSRGVYACPTVYDGTVYVGSNQGNIYAVDAETGDEGWRLNADTSDFASSPTVADGILYIGTPDGKLYAVNSDTGEKEWVFDINSIFNSFGSGEGIRSSPTVVSGVVYFGATNGSLYAVDALTNGSSTGSRVRYGTLGHHHEWANTTEPNINPSRDISITNSIAALIAVGFPLVAGYRRLSGTSSLDTLNDWPQPGRDSTNTSGAPGCRAIAPSGTSSWIKGNDETTAPVVANDAVVVGRADGVITANEARTGQQLWSTPVGENLPAIPAVEFSSVYVSSGTTLAALDYQSGNEDWTVTLASPAVGSPRPNDDRVYVSCEDGTVLAFNGKRGTEQWQASLPTSIAHGPAVTDNQLVVSTTASTVAAFDIRDGEEIWTVDIQGDCPSAPSLIDEVVYLADCGGTIHAIDATNGLVKWTLEVDVEIPEHVATTAGSVWLAGRHGTVVGVDTDAGETMWCTEIGVSPTGLAVVEETVYVAGESCVWGLNATTGDERWNLKLDGQATGLAPTNDALYVGTTTGLAGYQDETLEGDWGTTTTDAADETDTESTDDETRGSEQDVADSATPRNATGRFAHVCESVNGAESVNDTGPVHVYDGQFVDLVGEEDARIYALAPEHATDETAAEAFETTAREWQSISKNTHVATVYDTGTEPRSWVAFDLGHDRLDDAVTTLGRDERVAVIADVAEAMRTGSMYNLVHGDLTPETVFLTDNREGDQIATVADWGLERVVREAVEESEVTPYTAPEQLDGANAGDDTDIYRLGALAYRVLTGEAPFADKSDLPAAIADNDLTPPTEHDPTLPDEVDDILADAMAPDPNDRPASTYELRQRLVGAMGD